MEVKACKTLLQALNLRYFTPEVTSCPGCGRTNSDTFIHLSKNISAYIEKNMPEWKKKYQGIEMLKIAVMGCVVNGPGESKHADIGISLPGYQEDPHVPVYQNGKLYTLLKGERIEHQFKEILNA